MVPYRRMKTIGMKHVRVRDTYAINEVSRKRIRWAGQMFPTSAYQCISKVNLSVAFTAVSDRAR